MKQFHEAAARLLAGTPTLSAAGLDAGQIAAQVQRPPQPEMGDLGFPCFALAKTLKKAPPAIAQEIAAGVTLAGADGALFASVKPVGPYVNFVAAADALTGASVVAGLRPDWGADTSGAGKTVVIDFSSPNIAKPLGVHHIRSTMIGAALARLYEACGWRVVKVNHLGDWGTNFGQLMVAFKAAEAAGRNPGTDIDSQLKLYIEYHNAKDDNPALEDEARGWFKKLEDGDAEATRLWRIFLDESIIGLKKLYARLNVVFDYYTGESFFNDKMEATAARIKDKGILEESEGALVVRLEDMGMDAPCLIRKTDGATTYATRDLAAAEYRQSEYQFNKCLYVVANQQELHFRQIFSVLKKMGYGWAEGCEHVKFGMLSFGPGVFGEERTTGSTRKGNVIFLEDVLNRSVAEARKIIEENAREDEVKNQAVALAEQVGVGAIIFTEFMQRRQKDVIFTWEKALNMHGDSGPYLQYTHARLCSLIRASLWSVSENMRTFMALFSRPGEHTEAFIAVKDETDFTLIKSNLEKSVMLKLAEFPEIVQRTVIENEPSMVAEYLLELCTVFNRMYADKQGHQIITDDAALTSARVTLVAAVKNTLARGLALLGLGAPERM